MAKIISISLGEDLLKDIDSIQGFSGRSDIVRSGVKLLLDDLKEKEKMKGHGECALILIYDEKYEKNLIKTKHGFDDIISTQIRNNLCNKKCMEIFVLHGPSEKINAFFELLRKNKHSEYVKLVVP